jgi:hypothetical protein
LDVRTRVAKSTKPAASTKKPAAARVVAKARASAEHASSAASKRVTDRVDLVKRRMARISEDFYDMGTALRELENDVPLGIAIADPAAVSHEHLNALLARHGLEALDADDWARTLPDLATLKRSSEGHSFGETRT